MAWFEDSIIHQSWNRLLEITFPKIAESEIIESSLNLPQGMGGIIPWLIFAGMISAVIFWDVLRAQKSEAANP